MKRALLIGVAFLCAAHFLIRQVRAHPGQVTIIALGPLTNIALPISIDPNSRN